MKSFIYPLLTGAALGVGALASCTDGYEAEPVEKFTLDYVFSTTDSVGTQARQYLNNIYRHLVAGHNRVGGDYLDAASDDAISIAYDDADVYRLAVGRYTANSRVSADMGWADYYTTIREVAIFINNIDVVPFNLTYIKAGQTATDADGNLLATPLNATLKAEARFLRAYAYFELVKRYGGVPLLGDRVFDLNDDLQLPRNSFADCIDYIVGELDAIKDDLRGLPMHGSDATNYAACPTREACLAFIARVRLYAASRLFNESPIELGNELVGYPSYSPDRWTLAADAAKALIDDFDSPSGANGAVALNANFRNVFINFYNSDNPETIWFIQDELSGYNLERNNGPLGFTGNAIGSGRTLPSQNLVEAFPMKDGRPIGESPAYTYSASTQYDNRDPRLDMTVLHNGSNWLGRRLATYEGGGNNPTSSSLYSRTSYYMCKFMGNYTSGATEYTGNPHPWVVFRYAEVLLNYAEAQNEAQPGDESIRKCLIALRRRAGIEPGADGSYGIAPGLSQDQMRQLIYNERRIEMAFEEQRYYDLRRWRLAEEVFAQPVRGLKITNRDGVLSYADAEVLNVRWDNKRYFYPIPYNEVLKNSNMVQNPNW